MGSRYLKKSLLYPLVDLHLISERHDLIELFLKNYILTEEVKKDLLEIYDLERIVGRISYGPTLSVLMPVMVPLLRKT